MVSLCSFFCMEQSIQSPLYLAGTRQDGHLAVEAKRVPEEYRVDLTRCICIEDGAIYSSV
jgi:hypothetical protein